MSGNSEGGKKARDTIYSKYGKNHYSEIGKKGGAAGHTGGFTGNSELARRIGRLGAQKRWNKYYKERRKETMEK